MLETCGPRQMKIYAAKLNADLAAIAGQPKIGTHFEEHIVLYEADDREIRIARVLHKRMNMTLYL